MAETYPELSQERTWEYFAGLAFAYYDAPEGTDDVNHAWHELGMAIKHYRAAGGIEPRDPDEIDVWLVPEPAGPAEEGSDGEG